MRIQGVGAALDPVELEIDAGALAHLVQARMDAFGRTGTELGLQVLAPVYAFRRQVRIQLEGMPMHFGVGDLGGSQRLFQPALAHEAPGANDVRKYVYAHADTKMRDFGLWLGAEPEKAGAYSWCT